MIPVLHVQGRSLAKAYENALLELYFKGCKIETQYDNKDDPSSIDATMNITVEEPLTDPIIHKAFPGGIEDLREYVYELEGRKDEWVKNMNDPNDTRWEYTYHQRLADWGAWYENRSLDESPIEGRYKTGLPLQGSINQFDIVVNKLAESLFTRRAQMITWMPFIDNDVYDPPCLQSLWYRVSKEDSKLYLNCNVRFRSNDAWGANFMNMFGIVMMNKDLILTPLEEKTGKEIKMGRLNWQADSYHLYGKDQKEFRERFLNRLEDTDFKDRIYNFRDDMIQEIWNEATDTVLKKIEDYESRTTS
jgi:thymidylate synthase